ncbi:MAG: hypothetical protein J5950_06850 [Clostridia bacterium]|nr:hypothetical protein [Clostridia bacterium]
MKIRRVLMVLLALALTAGLVSCKTGGNEPGTPTDQNTAVPTEVPTEAPTEAPETGIDEPLDLPYAADFTVSKAFSKNMVVQRGEHIRVWGWADESENGKKVSGEFLGMFTEAEIKDGEWVMTFKKKLTANAELGNNMRIYTDTKEVVFEDVLVGDVYMCIGQSNCAYSMQNHWSYIDKNDEVKFGNKTIDKEAPIRLFYNSFYNTPTGLKRGTEAVNKDVATRMSWKKAANSTVSQFSAIGYMFAAIYVRATEGKIPVGVIEIDGNGLPIGAFVSNEVAVQCKTDRYDEKKKYYVTSGVNANEGRYMYNEYMYPYERMAMAGIVWYQGESDLQTELMSKYADTFTALMTYMRGTHNLINKDFPVYFVEFPSIYPNTTGAKEWHYMDLGVIRAKMGEIVTMLPNSYQIVSSDAWADRTFYNSLHPNCKYEQALRGANIALALHGEGGMTMEKATGPIVESVSYSSDGKTAIIKFKNVGSGLKTIDGAAEVKGFAGLTAANNPSKKSVTAKIVGTDTVEVTASFELYGVAYNCVSENFFGESINLANGEGNPAGAFMLNR